MGEGASHPSLGLNPTNTTSNSIPGACPTQGRPSRGMGSACILVAKFNSMLTWSPGGWPLEAAVLPRFTLSGSYRAGFQVRAVLLCQYLSQVSYLPCSFRGPPSCQGQGSAPLAGAPGTPSLIISTQ